MVQQQLPTRRFVSAGDAAVDGLLAGVMAGVAKGFFLVLAGFLAGSSWQEVLIRLDPQASSGLRGMLAHLAVAGIYGALFGADLDDGCADHPGEESRAGRCVCRGSRPIFSCRSQPPGSNITAGRLFPAGPSIHYQFDVDPI